MALALVVFGAVECPPNVRAPVISKFKFIFCPTLVFCLHEEYFREKYSFLETGNFVCVAMFLFRVCLGRHDDNM